ncbi:MAG: 2-amino-4-hydroxy-6-hydroxymethyldihydropteridine diphosphokinase [Planctomycetes bacterium]|nr:2-amino-4-hydroxy-6-hydroxymethyldihydropteridine diphosphokinase [Planctomycetota bacterium]
MSVAAIGLGSNLGRRRANLNAAIRALARLPGTRLAALSRFIETEPVGPPQPRFLNAAVLLETTLSPEELLGALLGIEAALGRIRDVPRGPRCIDLDLLTHGTSKRRSAHLILPHPELHRRAFVLEPLAEIAPGLRIPGRGRVLDLLAKIRR